MRRSILDSYRSICINDLEALQSTEDRSIGWYYEAARVCLHWAIVTTCYPLARAIGSGILFLILFMFTTLAIWQVLLITLLFFTALHPLLVFGLFQWRARGVYEQISDEHRAIHDRREAFNAVARRFCGSGADPFT